MKRFLLALAVVVAGVGVTSSAQAGLITPNGTFAFTSVGTPPTYSGQNVTPLSSATTITFTSVETITTTVPTSYLGNPNNLPVAAFTIISPPPAVQYTVTINPADTTLAVVNGTSLGLTDFLSFGPSGNLKFDLQSIVWTANAGANTLSFTALGTFHDDGGTFSSALASLSGTFTQVGGATGAVSGGFTFATPPQFPEPGSFTLMGIGAVGIGAVTLRRHRQKKASV